MSPQMSTLGRISGFSNASTRSDSSGMYRPEDNAYYQYYTQDRNLDYFRPSGKRFYFSITGNDPTYPSGLYVKNDLSSLYYCGGLDDKQLSSIEFSTDNLIGYKNFSTYGDISTLSSSATIKRILWYESSLSYPSRPEPSGISFKPDGSQVILCGNLNKYVNNGGVNEYRQYGSIIFQYSLSTSWDINTIQGTAEFSGISPSKIYYFDGGSYTTSGFPTTGVIRDIFVHPDGDKFYYIRDNYLYQGSISSAWDIGSTGQNLNTNVNSLFLDATLVSSQDFIGSFTGIHFSSDGKTVFITSRGKKTTSPLPLYYYGPTIFQYNLSTAWNISTASFVGSHYAGVYRYPFPDQTTNLSWSFRGSSMYMYPSNDTFLLMNLREPFTSLNNEQRTVIDEYNILRY